MHEAEIAWLLERRDLGAAHYWAGGDSWTSDPNCVVRFARRDDVLRVLFWMSDVASVAFASEHMWCPSGISAH